MAVRDRWHLSFPPEGAKRCGKHKLVPSAEHGLGLRWQGEGLDDRRATVRQNFDTEQAAKDWVAELRSSVRAGRYVDERAGRVTLQSRCVLWLDGRQHDPATRERVERAFANHVYPDPDAPSVTPRGGVAIGELPMLLLSRQPSRIAGWLARLPLHPNGKILLFDLVSSVFDAAVADHIIHENPFKSRAVTKPERKNAEVVAWEPATIDAVSARLPARVRALPVLAAACGHRQGEGFAVAVPDLGFPRARTCRIAVQVKQVGGQLVFAPIKNDRPRTPPLADYARDVLAAHLAEFPAVPVTLPWLKPDHTIGKPLTRELVFTRADGTPWTRSAFNPYWRAAWQAEGIAEPEDSHGANGFHVCRHSAASAWLSGGLSVPKVAAMLGDTVAVVSKTYAHFLPSDEERARDIMNRHFQGVAERGTSRQPPLRVAR